MGSDIINLIKKNNIDMVLDALKRCRTATKPYLAEQTGISLVTVNSLIKDLLKSGEVLEDVVIQPQLGRPTATYKYNAEHKLGLLIFMHEVKGEDIANFVIINLYGEKIEETKKVLGNISKQSFDTSIQEILDRHHNIEVIGFGLPGVEVNGKLKVSDYVCLLDVEFTAYIQEKFNRTVFIENDINAATIGYCCKDTEINNECVIGLYFPSKYPPGAGICRKGELVKGKDGLAGEIRYLPLDIDWNDFNYQEDKINHVILAVIRIFMCLYNPEKIVIYKEKNEFNYINELERTCMSNIEKILIPEVIISNTLNTDFEKGMICLALGQLVKK